MDKLRVRIGVKDAKKAGTYWSSECLLGTALKRLYPDARLGVGTDWVTIDDVRYDFVGETESSIVNSYESYRLHRIDFDKFKPFVARLQRV